MGKYKEENGTTRVGDLLRSLGDVGKPILNAAAGLTGQQWLSSIADGIKSSSELREEQIKILMELYSLDVEDRKSARTMNVELNKSKESSWLSKNMPALLACFLTLMVGFIVYGLMKFEIPAKNEPVIYSLIGTIGTAWLASIYFWVGSSKGSHDKNHLITKK